MFAKCTAGKSSRVGEKAETRIIPRFLAQPGGRAVGQQKTLWEDGLKVGEGRGGEQEARCTRGAHWHSGWGTVRPQHSELSKAVDSNHVFPKGIKLPLSICLCVGAKHLNITMVCIPSKGHNILHRPIYNIFVVLKFCGRMRRRWVVSREKFLKKFLGRAINELKVEKH